MDRATLLANISLFESLSPEDITALTERLQERTYEAGARIFHQGDQGMTLFVIDAGSVDISFGDDKSTVELATLFRGQYFGELSLFDGAPRSATARAATDCVLLALDREDFAAFLMKSPGAALRIMSEMSERMRQTNELMARQVSRNVVEEAEEQITIGQKVADRVAAFGGSWPFIILFASLMALWMVLNSLLGNPFDPFPFILLNLMLSTLAALQAPIIMMSQNRQAAKDKLLAENDYFVNLKSEVGIERLLKGQTEIFARLTLLERYVQQSGGASSGSRPTAAS